MLLPPEARCLPAAPPGLGGAREPCYNHRHRPVAALAERVWSVPVMWTAEFFWRLFERTGSILAYLLYRQLLASE